MLRSLQLTEKFAQKGINNVISFTHPLNRRLMARIQKLLLIEIVKRGERDYELKYED